MTHRRASLDSHQREPDRQRRRREPMPMMDEPAPEDLRRERGLECRDLARVEVVHAHSRGAVGRVGLAPERHLLLVEGHGEQPDRLLVEAEGDRALLGDLEVAREAGPGHREKERIGRGQPQAVVATRCGRGELLTFEQRDRCAGPSQLVGARRTDDPTSDGHDVRHAGGSLPGVL